MSIPYHNRQPLLDYPSWLSLGQLLVGMIEQSAGAIPPDDWEENERYYLDADIPGICESFRDTIADFVKGAEPPDWVLRDLSDFEREIAEDLLAHLESAPETRHTLNTLRTLAFERYMEGRRQEERRQQVEPKGQSDDLC